MSFDDLITPTDSYYTASGTPDALSATTDFITMGIPAAVASAGISIVNTAISLGNAFGMETEEIDTREVLHDAGFKDTADYYMEHKEGIDAAGFIGGVFVPGLGGIKMLRGIQVSAALTKSGRLSTGFLKRALVPDTSLTPLINGLKTKGESVFTTLSNEKITMIANGFHQQALESAAFEGAVLLTMNQNPTLDVEDLGYFDSIASNLGGAAYGMLFGTVIGGTLHAVSSVGKVKRVYSEWRESNPELFTRTAEGDLNVPVGDLALKTFQEYARVRDINPANLTDDAARLKKKPELKARSSALQQSLLKLTNNDADLANQLFGMLKDKNVEQATAFLSSTQSIKPWHEIDNIFELPLQDVEHALRDDWTEYLYEVVQYKEKGKRLSKSTIAKLLNSKKGLAFSSLNENTQLAGRGAAFTPESAQWDSLITWRHEIGHLNTYELTNLIDKSKLGKRIKEQGIRLSKIHRADSWNTVDEDFIRSRPLEEQLELRKLQAELESPEELFADSQAVLSDKNLFEEAKKLAPDMYKLLIGNKALAAKYEPSKSILDLNAQELLDTNISPTIADLAGTPRYIKGKTNSVEYGKNGNQRVSLKQEFNIDELTPIEANALYTVSKVRKDIQEGNNIDWLDLPRLTAAYAQDIKVNIVKDGNPIENDYGLAFNILKAKNIIGRELIKKRTSEGAPMYTTSEIARMIDTGDNFVLRVMDVTAMDSDSAFNLISNKTDFDRDIPFWSARPEVDPMKPSYGVLRVDKKTMQDDQKLNSLVNAEIRIKQARVVRDTAVAMFLGKEGKALPTAAHAQYLDDEIDLARTVNPVHSINPLDKTSGTLTAAHMKHLTGGSWAQFIGKITNRIKKAKYDLVDSTFNSSIVALRKDPEAIREAAVLDSVLRQDKYKFIPETVDEFLVNIDRDSIQEDVIEELAAKGTLEPIFQEGSNRIWTTKLARLFTNLITKERSESALEAKIEQFENAVGTNVKTIANKNLVDFWRNKVAFNGRHIVTPKRTIAGLKGFKSTLDPEILYPGKLDTTTFSHFALVTSNSKGVMAGKDIGMIVAHDAARLQQKIVKAEEALGDKISVHLKSETEEFLKLQGLYEKQLLFRDNIMDSTLKNHGVAWDILPEPDVRLFDQYITGMKQELSGLVKSHVEVKYGEELATLKEYSKSIDIYNSTFGKPKKWRGKVRNIYEDTRKMLLDVSNKDPEGWWETANTLSAEKISTMYAAIKGAFYNAAHHGEWEKMNEVLKHYGLDAVYSKSSQLLLTKANAPESVMPELVGKLNSVIATSMLRLDVAQAVVNTISTPIMLVPEFKAMVRAARADRVQILKNGTTIAIPGSTKTLSSLNSILFQATKELAKGKASKYLEKYRDMGLLDGTLQELQRAMELTAELPITESKGLLTKINKIVNMAAKPVDMSEQYIKFVAAYTADTVGTTLGVSDNMINASINNFVTKVHGNYLASQRPTLFQGWAGQAIGLFQTYQFNLMQGLFRHVENGNKAAIVSMGLLQGGIFGAQSIPGFQLANQFIGERSREDNDFYRTTKNLVGEDVGNWLLYGTASNLMVPIIGDGIDLYSRGDLTPRTPILLPTSPSEVPLVSFYGKAIGNLLNFQEKITNGAPINQSFADLLAHNGMNRPLQGLINLYVGERTTRAGSLLRTYQTLDAWNILTKAMGTKTLNEAVAVSATYRMNAYKTYRTEQLKDLGEAFKANIRAGGFNTDVYNDFATKYAAVGGNISQFSRWVTRQYAGATESQINKLRDNNNSPEGRYLQEVLGGAVEDYNNRPVNPMNNAFSFE